MKSLISMVGLVVCVGLVVVPCMNAAPLSNLKTQAAANNKFAIELYRQLMVEDGNLFLSPYSISTALAMTYAERGATRPHRWPTRCSLI